MEIMEQSTIKWTELLELRDSITRTIKVYNDFASTSVNQDLTGIYLRKAAQMEELKSKLPVTIKSITITD